ncbi:hypothetical protein [Myroides sp. LJL119]
MKIKIVYSWQSSTDLIYNKNFIQECLEEAIKNLEKDPLFNENTLILEESTREVSGSPQLASKIMDERIPQANIFVADLTFVNGKIPEYINEINRVQYRKDNKPTPNPNVLIEYGIAYSNLTESKIIGIINSDFGSLKIEPNLMPFDLKHLRRPIEYEYNENSNKEIVKLNLTTTLTDELRLCIERILTEQNTKFYPFNRWEEWNELFDSSLPFVINEFVSGTIEKIKCSIIANRTVRILGLSGLGKSRLLLEMFRPKGDAESKAFSAQALYYDFQDNSHLDLKKIVTDLQKNEENKVLILDNCDKDTHTQLLRYFSKSTNKLSLITVDSNPEEIEESKNPKIDYLKITNQNLGSIVDKIIEEYFVLDRNKDYIKKRIKDFSDNNPLMATLICENWKEGVEELGLLDDKTLLKKLLGSEASNDEKKAILCASSLFSSFGFEDDLSKQLEFIATQKDITSVNSFSHEIIINQFRGVCNFYLKRGIFEKRGRKIQMRPIPLALYLASEWLSTCDSDKILRIINDIAAIESFENRNALMESLAKQMRFFGTQKKAIEIVENLTSRGGAFHNAEVLNTELGSRLFRSFVEVNPKSTSQALWAIYGGMTQEDLLRIVAGRRNIILSLSKLCFIESTFSISVKTLFMFALAENEHWANNSVGELRSLFKIFLPGTQANLAERFNILEWGYKRVDNSSKGLALKCIESALSSSHFSRILGAEEHGVVTLKEYMPQTEEEITNYWKSIINLIIEPILTDNTLNNIRIKIILDSLFSFIRYKEAEFIFSKLEVLFEQEKWSCIEGLESLIHVRKINYDFLYGDCLERIDHLVERLSCDSFTFKFVHGLKLLEYKKVKDDFNSSFISHEESNSFYRNLGKEFIEEKISWKDSLPVVLSSDPLYTRYFGSEISKFIKLEEIKPFIDQTLTILNELPRDKRNYSILEGFASNLSSSNKKVLYKSIVRFQDLEYLYIYLITSDKKGYIYFDELIDLVRENPDHIMTLSKFSYSNAFVDCPSESLISFLNELIKITKQFIPFICQVLFYILKNGLNTDNVIKSYTKTIILKYGDYFILSDYRIGMFMIDYIESERSNEIAVKYNQIIISNITLENVFNIENTAKHIYKVLLSTYFDVVWDELANCLIGIGEDYFIFCAFKQILGAKNRGIQNSSLGLLFEGNNIDAIFKWANKNNEIAPARLAELVPIYDGQNDIYNKLNPIAERLLSEFGEDETVLRSFSINMGSFTWSGSVIPLLEGRREIFEKLSNHEKSSVKNWALNNLRIIEKEIKIEKDRDEEIYL